MSFKAISMVDRRVLVQYRVVVTRRIMVLTEQSAIVEYSCGRNTRVIPARCMFGINHSLLQENNNAVVTEKNRRSPNQAKEDHAVAESPFNASHSMKVQNEQTSQRTHCLV